MISPRPTASDIIANPSKRTSQAFLSFSPLLFLFLFRFYPPFSFPEDDTQPAQAGQHPRPRCLAPSAAQMTSDSLHAHHPQKQAHTLFSSHTYVVLMSFSSSLVFSFFLDLLLGLAIIIWVRNRGHHTSAADWWGFFFRDETFWEANTKNEGKETGMCFFFLFHPARVSSCGGSSLSYHRAFSFSSAFQVGLESTIFTYTPTISFFFSFLFLGLFSSILIADMPRTVSRHTFLLVVVGTSHAFSQVGFGARPG